MHNTVYIGILSHTYVHTLRMIHRFIRIINVDGIPISHWYQCNIALRILYFVLLCMLLQ